MGLDVGGIGALKKELTETNAKLDAVHAEVLRLNEVSVAAVVEELRALRQQLGAQPAVSD